MALSVRSNEGEAAGSDSLPDGGTGAVKEAEPAMSNAALAHLRVRVISLKNLLLAMLAQASDEQLRAARERATCFSRGPVSPRTRWPCSRLRR